MESEVQDRLPFSEVKQRAILGHLLVNPGFFKQAKTHIEPDWFVNDTARKVCRALFNYYEEHEVLPTAEELKESKTFLMQPENRDIQRCRFMVDHAMLETANFQIDPLKVELTDWLQARYFALHSDKAVRLFNSQRLELAFDEMKRMTREIDGIQFEGEHESSFSNFPQEFQQNEKQILEAGVTFGVRLLDRKLLPDGSSGGLLPGDTTLLLAPTNIGKTTTMITMLRHNIYRQVDGVSAGKSVLFLTHEGRETDIKEKIWCSMLGVNRPQLYAMYKTEEGEKKMWQMLKLLNTYLTYVPYNKAGATIEDVENIIRRKQEQRIARYGKGYDLVIDDYPAKLSTVQAQHGKLEYRHIQEFIYNRFVQLALEYNFHAVCAIQTNRQGSKKNRGYKNRWEEEGEANRLLTMEDVAESWGPMTIATNVISINRDERAMAKNRVIFYICKSRSNETGWAVLCESRYDHALTHSDNPKDCRADGKPLRATAYRSSHTMSERADDLLDQYNGETVRDTALFVAPNPTPTNSV